VLIVTQQRPIRDLQSDLDAEERNDHEENDNAVTNKDDYIVLDSVGESLELS